MAIKDKKQPIEQGTKTKAKKEQVKKQEPVSVPVKSVVIKDSKTTKGMSTSNKILSALLAVTVTLFVVLAALFVVFLTKEKEDDTDPPVVRIVYSVSTISTFNDAVYALSGLEKNSSDLLDLTRYDLLDAIVKSFENAQVKEEVVLKIASFIDSIPEFIEDFDGTEEEKNIIKDFFSQQFISIDSLLELMINFEVFQPLAEKATEFFDTGITVEQFGDFLYYLTNAQLGVISENGSILAWEYERSIEGKMEAADIFATVMIEFGPGLIEKITSLDVFKDLCHSMAALIKDMSYSFTTGPIQQFFTLINDVYSGNINAEELIVKTQELATKLEANKNSDGKYLTFSRDTKKSIITFTSRARTFLLSAEILINEYIEIKDSEGFSAYVSLDDYYSLIGDVNSLLNSQVENLVNNSGEAVYALLNNFNKEIDYVASNGEVAKAKVAVLFANELLALRNFKTGETTLTEFDYENLTIIISHLIDEVFDIASESLIDNLGDIAIYVAQIIEQPIKITTSGTTEPEEETEGEETGEEATITEKITEIVNQINMTIKIMDAINGKIQNLPVYYKNLSAAELLYYEQYLQVFNSDFDPEEGESANEVLLSITDYADMFKSIFDFSSDEDLLLSNELLMYVSTPIMLVGMGVAYGVGGLFTLVANPIVQLINPEKTVEYDDVVQKILLKFVESIDVFYYPLFGTPFSEIVG